MAQVRISSNFGYNHVVGLSASTSIALTSREPPESFWMECLQTGFGYTGYNLPWVAHSLPHVHEISNMLKSASRRANYWTN